jgi:hypothetical protein
MVNEASSLRFAERYLHRAVLIFCDLSLPFGENVLYICQIWKPVMQLQQVLPTPAQIASLGISDDEAGALARATVNLFKAWRLTDAEACILLGGMSARTWARWKESAHGRIDRDLRTRMAHLMGIHKGLRYLFRDPARGYEWVRKPNAAFGGMSALHLMLRGEISDLAALRDWLDAERGAW